MRKMIYKNVLSNGMTMTAYIDAGKNTIVEIVNQKGELIMRSTAEENMGINPWKLNR